MYLIEEFTKKHDKIICIDSDGTVIDAMNVKHIRCHGASFIAEWGLEQKANEILKIWCDINLYEPSRGVNRFIAVLEMLERINGKYLTLDPNELKKLKDWVKAGELSNKSLEVWLQKEDSPLMRKALHWSKDLNRRISELTPADKPPFPGAREALEYAHGNVDIAIVSSSNMSAIVEEWRAHRLLGFVDVVTSQEIGSKSECIATLLKCGYAPGDLLMLGDAYPDLDAAKANETWYYPIYTRHEQQSWNELRETYLDAFTQGRFGQYQDRLIESFINNFNTKER